MDNTKLEIVPSVETKPVRNNYEVSISNGFSTTLKRDVDFGMIFEKGRDTDFAKTNSICKW